MNFQSITGFKVKDCLSLPSLVWNYFNSKLDKDVNEATYSYTDKFVRRFVSQSIKGGKVGAFNQKQSTISDDIFLIISEEFNIKSNKYEIIEEYTSNINMIKLKFEKEHK